MKTLTRSLLPSSLGSLALACLFALTAPLARAQTTVWEGDSTTSNHWSDAENWSNGVPTSSSHAVIGGPLLDVDATVGSLTFGSEGGSLWENGFARTLIVQGTTTFENLSEDGISISIMSGSNFQLGTTNFPPGTLYGYFGIEDYDPATTTPTVVQFRDADVRDNRGFIYLYGPDAALLDQNTGAHALRNLEQNNNVLYFADGAAVSTTGTLTNNYEVYVFNFAYSGMPATRFTVDGSFINNRDGFMQILSGAQMTVTGDFINSSGGRSGSIFIENSNGGAGDTILGVNGNFINAGGGEIYVYGGTGTSPVRLNVGGDLNNAGLLNLRGGGSVDVGGTLSMTSGEIIRNADGTAEIFQISAGQINLAAATRFDMTRATIFADVVEHGTFATDTYSPGDATINGSLTLTDTAQWEVQIAGTTPGRGFTRHDQIRHFAPAGGTGSVVLDGILKLSVIHDFHKTITPQDTFSILVSDRMLSGAFNNVASGGRLQTTDGHGSFLVTYAGQNSVVLSQFQPAPSKAQFVSQQVPAVVNPGQSYAVQVTMKNTGTTTWTAAQGYKLGSFNPRDNFTWGSNRVRLPSGASVAPGASHTFVFNVTAPTAAGTYDFQWQMLQEGVARFGDKTPNVAVNVTAPVLNAAYVSQQVPTSMVAGEIYPASITLRNTGTTTWKFDYGYKLAAQNPHDNFTWGMNRVRMPAGVSVPPGASYTFTFNVTAPFSAGSYNFQWRMLQESVSRFGGYTPNVVIQVQ